MKKAEIVKALANELKRKIESNKGIGAYKLIIDAEIDDKEYFAFASVEVLFQPEKKINFKFGVMQDVKSNECTNIKFLLKNLLS